MTCGRACWDGVRPEALDFTASIAAEVGVDHAGFDIAWCEGYPYLLEFNVRFGTRGLLERGIRVPEAILAHLARSDGPCWTRRGRSRHGRPDGCATKVRHEQE